MPKVIVTLLGVTVGLQLIFVSASAAQDDKSGGVNINTGAVVGHTAGPDEQKFEWTLERMLMATPMPLTQEERVFLQTHPNLDGIRTWSLKQFNEYISSTLGKHHVAETAVHWRGNVEMLAKQTAAGAAVLGRKSVPVPAVSAKTNNTLEKGTLEQIQALLAGPEAEDVFERMKLWRQDVAVLAPAVESMRKEAATRGLSQQLEDALSDQ